MDAFATGWRLPAGIFFALCLAGCAATPPLPETPLPVAMPVVTTEAPRVFELGGRISVKYRELSSSGNLRWQHSPAHDDILLFSPLGQTVAQVIRDAAGVTLIDQDNKVHRAADAETLTQQLLGWRLPLSGLGSWVVGQAVPGGSHSVERDAEQRPTRLEQDGWRLDYSAWQTTQGRILPRKLILQREDLEIRLVVDEWMIPEQTP